MCPLSALRTGHVDKGGHGSLASEGQVSSGKHADLTFLARDFPDGEMWQCPFPFLDFYLSFCVFGCDHGLFFRHEVRYAHWQQEADSPEMSFKCQSLSVERHFRITVHCLLMNAENCPRNAHKVK